MEHRFDELAKALAQGVSRREALRRFGGALAGAIIASLGFERAWGQGNSNCAHFCQAVFSGGDADHCTSDAAHGQGVCPACEADVTRFCPGAKFAQESCCPRGTTCVNGQCLCPSGQALCSVSGTGPTRTASCCDAASTCCGPNACCPTAPTAATCCLNPTSGANACCGPNAPICCLGDTTATCCGLDAPLCCQGTCFPRCPDGQVLNPLTCQCVCPPGTTPCGPNACCTPPFDCCQGACRKPCPPLTSRNPNTCQCESITCGPYDCSNPIRGCGGNPSCSCVVTVGGLIQCGALVANQPCNSDADCGPGFCGLVVNCPGPTIGYCFLPICPPGPPPPPIG